MWYNGKYECGHEGSINVLGPTKNRQYIVDREFSGLCPECAKKAREEENAKKTEKAAATAKENEYPDLKGTEKQANWALIIRDVLLNKASEDIASEACKRYPYAAYDKRISQNEKVGYTIEIMEWLIQHEDAKWWIDNRFTKNICDFTQQYEEEKLKKEEKAIDKEIVEATIIEPIKKEHAGVVEIQKKGDRIKLYYPKNDEFRELVKSKFYRWGGPWYRDITKWSGPINDRVIEIGNALLNAGFAIEIEGDLKECAINGEFQDERTTWIRTIEEGDRKGWFLIKWKGKDDELYKKARKLPGSRWDRESVGVVVPETSFKEIGDFADMESFSISEEAEEIIQEKSKTVLIAEPKVHKKPKKEDKLKKQLEQEVEIPSDLRDED